MGKRTIATILTLKDQFTPKIKKVAEGTDNAKKKMKEMDRQLKVGQNKLKDYGSSIMKVAKKFELLSGAAAIASIKMAMDFQQGMEKIRTIAPDIDLNKYGDQILALSSKTGMAAKDLENSIYDAISSGVAAGEDALKFTETAVKTAKVGFTDTNTAVDALTSVLNSYGKKTDEAGQISKEMFIAQNLGKTTIDQMAQSIGNVTPFASTLKVKTDELFSSIAVLTAGGIKTSESITGLKAAMSNIVKPSQQAADLAGTIGLKFNSSALAAKGWMPFLVEARKKLEGSIPAYVKTKDRVDSLNGAITAMEKKSKRSKSENASLKSLRKQAKMGEKQLKFLEKASGSTLDGMAQLFGSVEGLNSMLSLTSEQGMKLYNDSLLQMRDNSEKSKNMIDDAYKKFKESPWEKFSDNLNKLRNIGIELGNDVMPTVTSVLDDLSGAIDTCKQNMDLLIPIAAGVLSAILAYQILAPIVQLYKDWKIATEGAAAAQSLLNFVMTANPIGLIVIGIGILIAAGVALYKNWDTVKAGWSKIWDIMGNVASNTGIILGNVWIGIQNGFTSMYNVLVGGLNYLSDKLKELTSFKVPDWVPLIGGMTSTGIDLGHAKQKEKLKYNEVGSIYGSNLKDVYKAPFKKVDKKMLQANIKKRALGTNYATEGLTLINERGGELRQLSSGETVIPADKSKQLIDKAGGNTNVYVTIQGNVIGNEEYANYIGEHVAGRVILAIKNS